MIFVILAGGFGTRLKEAVQDVPKPMAPITNQPFLEYLLNYVGQDICKRAILLLHHKSEQVISYFGESYKNLKLDYIVEDEPLGTGGAILNAVKKFRLNEPFIVLNGDTFVEMDYQKFYDFHISHTSDMSIATRMVKDCSRYAAINTNATHTIVKYSEKGGYGASFISAGIYCINPVLMNSFQIPKKSFSLEEDFIKPNLHLIKPKAFCSDGYFIDIGIPEDYKKAQIDLPKITQPC